MLTSIGIVLHLQSSGSGLIPLPIKGWYKYTAVTEVTCPVEVSVPVTCSLPVSACRGVHSFRDVSWLRECPRRVLYPFSPGIGTTHLSRCHRAVLLRFSWGLPTGGRVSYQFMDGGTLWLHLIGPPISGWWAAACPTSLWTVASYGSTRQAHQFLDGGTLYLAG